jgi:hypothetical protein
MKASVGSGKVTDSLEMFHHGRKGKYLIIKYTVAQTSSGNYDFMFALFGYSWTLDSLTKEEAIQRLDLSSGISQQTHTLAGVPGDMIPEEAKPKLVEDVAEFVRIHSKTTISMLDKDNQINYFRSLSEKSLAYLCPKA